MRIRIATFALVFSFISILTSGAVSQADSIESRRLGVTMIPTQVFLGNTGKEIHRHIGFYGYEEVLPLLKKAGI